MGHIKLDSIREGGHTAIRLEVIKMGGLDALVALMQGYLVIYEKVKKLHDADPCGDKDCPFEGILMGIATAIKKFSMELYEEDSVTEIEKPAENPSQEFNQN